MANMSDYLENKMIDFLFRGRSFSAPGTLYVALCTVIPTDVSTGSTIVEPVGGNYARQAVVSGVGTWYSTQGDTGTASTGTTGTTSNVSAISWGTVTWSGTVLAVAICDSSSGGNMLWWGTLSSSQVVVSGNTITFNSSSLSIQIDN